MINKKRLEYSILAGAVLGLIALISLSVVGEALDGFARWMVFRNVDFSQITIQQGNQLTLRAYDWGAILGGMYLYGLPFLPLVAVPWARLRRRIVTALCSFLIFSSVIQLSLMLIVK